MSNKNSLKKEYAAINSIFDAFFNNEHHRLDKILKKIYHMQLSKDKNNHYFTVNGRSFLFKNTETLSNKDSSLCEEALSLGEHYAIFSNKYLKDKIILSVYFQKLYNTIYYSNINNPKEYFLGFLPEYLVKIPPHNKEVINSFFKKDFEKAEYEQMINLLDSYEANKLIF